MKVDPKGIVSHLRRAVRQDDRRMEDYLAGEIVDWIQRTDDLDAEVKALREALEAQQDAGSVAGDLREVEGLHPELHERLVPELRRIARIMDDPPKGWVWLTSHRATVREAATSIERLRAEVTRLRARVQPRRVSREEFQKVADFVSYATGTEKPHAVARGVIELLGLQIQGEGRDG